MACLQVGVADDFSFWWTCWDYVRSPEDLLNRGSGQGLIEVSNSPSAEFPYRFECGKPEHPAVNRELKIP